ncbi:MAG: hypothetical protein CMJ19_19950 [Phycisphaeraceae bacterium]|nr:hypothetical protein [Phycisphaeraceae bacterium]
MKKITIKDIARELGIHHTTVSRALRNHTDVKSNTRDLVLNKAKEMKYIQNTFAVGLRNNQSKNIGILVPSIQPHFFSSTISAITNLAHTKGFSVMIFQSNEDVSLEKKNITAMMEHGVAGVIASPSLTTENTDHFNQLKEFHIPLVLFDRVPDDSHFHRIKVDNFDAGFQATSYLIKNGQTEISFFTSKEPVSVFQQRVKGYESAMDKNKLKSHVDVGDITFGDGYQRAAQLINAKKLPRAILCATDQLALGMMKAFQKFQIKVPTDIAIIGFDDDPAGELVQPSLSTMAQPISEIAKYTFDALLRKIEHPSDPREEETTLKMKFIKRESTP